MFGKKRVETTINQAMGKLRFIGPWVGKMSFPFESAMNQLDLYIYVDEDDKYNFQRQENVFKFLKGNQVALSQKIQSVIRVAYDLNIDFSLSSRFTPNSIFIQMNGDCGISFNDNNLDLEVSPECFVITIYPEVEYFGSVEDYT
ncbi:MAG: hypothetical protein K2J26_02330 [Ruminococcus sp.]|nr:hypothetical protein [Ruminococcus sp.]